jgi:hypothetical protein
MNPVSTELWRKPETVPLSKFHECFHESIRKGGLIQKGLLPQDSESEINESKEAPPTQFSATEMDILREKLGVQLVHGDHTLEELKNILYEQTRNEGRDFKRR